MQTRRIIPILLMLLPLSLHAQNKANAVILKDEEVYTLSSPTSAELTVTRVVSVLSEAGEAEAVFHEFTDRYRSISSFKGTIEKEGQKPKKIGKGELRTVSLASGLAEDGFITAYSPSMPCPYTITYEYTISYKKAIATFPVYSPINTDKSKLAYGSFIIRVPQDYKIQYYSNLLEGPQTDPNSNYDSYKWEVKNYDGYVDESFMPSRSQLTPLLLSAPVEFTYAGTKGSQASWKEAGQWCYDLVKDTNDLPADFIARVKEMTSGCTTDLERIKAVYNYLRKETRYVSIQLGIGGYKPFPASVVQKSGFGDCKGLSNLAICMLAAIGIDSYYTILHTKKAKMFPGFCSLTQMNHAMLCVPLPEKNDTLWLECTNPTFPFGYRHEDIAGHDVLCISEDGGRLLNVPTYPDSLNKVVTDTEVVLHEDASANVKVEKHIYSSNVESWLSIRDQKPEDVNKKLSKGLSVLPQNLKLSSVKDNFDAYDGPGYSPEMTLSYNFDCWQYANQMGNRLFIPGNPVPKGMSLQRGKRINDIVSGHCETAIDHIKVTLPKGYTLESIPEDINLDTDWGTFKSSVKEEGGVVYISQVFHLKKFNKPAADYTSFKQFIRTLNKSAEATLALVKK